MNLWENNHIELKDKLLKGHNLYSNGRHNIKTYKDYHKRISRNKMAIDNIFFLLQSNEIKLGL